MCETYEIGRGEPGFDNIELTDCGFDPHAPIGSLGGAASVQEALALVGVAVRLLRDGTRRAELVGEHTGRGATYRVVTDPSAVSVAPRSRGPGLARQRRRERVSIAVSLGDFGRALDVRPPSCIAME